MSVTYVKLNATAIKRVYKKSSILWSAAYTIKFETQVIDSNNTVNSNDPTGNWTYGSLPVYYGDIIAVHPVICTADNTYSCIITCYKWDSPNEERWSNTITWPKNTAQYTYTNFITSLTGSKIIDDNFIDNFIDDNDNFTITASCTRTLNQYKITWKYLDAYEDPTIADNLASSLPVTANFGDDIAQIIPEIPTVINNSDVTARYTFEKWDKLKTNPTVTGDLTLTAQYQHQGKLSVQLTNCTLTEGPKNNTWHEYGTICSINVKAFQNWAFNSAGFSTASRSITVPGTIIVKAEYIYVTTDGTYCTPSVQTGWHAYGIQCTWDPVTYYSFEGGATQKSSTPEYLTIAGGTYTKEPQYVRVERLDSGPYASGATINGDSINNSTYYLNGSQVQWKATNSYSYSGESVEDLSSGTTIIPGGVMTAPNPGYVKCSISGDRVSTSPTSDTILAVGSTITWTATLNYSFAAGIMRDITRTQTVELGTTSYSKSADYKNISVSSVNCTADVSDGYRKLGDTITWTSSTITNNSKYSFSSTNINSTTATEIINVEKSAYTKKASYLWYNVTSATGTNCDAYTSSDYNTKFIPTWYLEGTKIYWKATGSAYAMDTSNATTLSVNVKAGNNNRSAVVKQYTFTLTKNTNVSSIKVWRTSSPYQGATVGSESTPLISNNNTATVYYGDVLNGKATSSTGYNFNGTNTNTSITYASGSITADKSWSPTALKNTYTVNLDLSALPSTISISDQWLSLEKTTDATHYPVGSTFNYNDTIYAIIRIQGSPTGIDTTASGWNLIYSSGQYNTYAIGSITATGTTSSLTIKPQAIVNNYPVTISSGYGYNNVYLSADPNATSGSPSGTEFPYNSTVYGFAILNVHTSKCSGTLISGTANTPGAIYRIGSKTVVASTTPFGEIALDPNSISVCFTGAGSDTGTVEFYISSPISASGYGSISKSTSGNSITISCETDNFNGDLTTSDIAKITYDSQYSASCILKNYANTEVAWNSSYSFISDGILLEVELSPGGSVSS